MRLDLDRHLGYSFLVQGVEVLGVELTPTVDVAFVQLYHRFLAVEVVEVENLIKQYPLVKSNN